MASAPPTSERPPAAASADYRSAPWGLTRFQLGLSLTLAIVVLAMVVSILRQPAQATPADNLRQALEFLDSDGPADRRRAEALATQVLREGYRDPNFPGGPEYVLGIVAFEYAGDAEVSSRDQLYEQAARRLREAEQHSLPDRWRPRWAYALGVSLYRLGLPHAAQPMLEEALTTYSPGRLDAAALLAETFLDLPSTNELNRALELSDTVVEELRRSNADDRRLETALLRQARVLLALGRLEEADILLQSAPTTEADSPSMELVRAQSLMARRTPESYRQAQTLLTRVSVTSNREPAQARQAGYLLGLCHEALGELDAAVETFERTARRHADTHEALAAHLRSAELLRKAGRNEEALAAYREALAMAAPPQDFRNRWLTLADLRRSVVAAWDDWVAAGHFEEASALSRFLSPTISAADAAELQARTSQRWAESLQANSSESPLPERHRDELLTRWCDSGRAFADLAERSRASRRYAEYLWTSAEHFRRGKNFLRSAELLEQFLATEPHKLLPLALVRSGQCLLALDHNKAASQRFQLVLNDHPTDPAAFEAAYWLGVCHLEGGQPQLAEAAWRRVLQSPDLTPAAEEWRLSLFALARLLHYETPPATSNASTNELSRRRLREAADRLDEYIRRYPESNEADEARYLLPKTYQHLAEHFRSQIKHTEIDTEQKSLTAKRRATLEQADVLLTDLLKRLAHREDAGSLGPFQERLLRDAHLTAADVEFALERYEPAIARYANAVNRYPHSPQVLTAYMQMAACYDRLGRAEEGRSMLQQARVILRRLPDEAFDRAGTNLRTRAEWQAWLDWAVRLREPPPGESF